LVEQPRWIEPMAATLSERPFSDPGWIFEPKLDGVRCLAFRSGAEIRLLSRNRQPLGDTFPEIVDRLAEQPQVNFVVDGEIVAMEHGRSSFARLQRRLGLKDPREARNSRVTVDYYLFDLLFMDGFDLRVLGVRDRKRLLRRAFEFGRGLRFTTHRNTEGEAFLSRACAKGWEGIIAKRADARYVSQRSRAWLKFKCTASQELVIGGFTDPTGGRVGFGALLLGYYGEGELSYAGKVGTGFDHATLVALRRRLDELEVPATVFEGGRRWPRGTHFVRPELVAEVGFTEWTRDGMLRAPRFLGLREDKAPREVVREQPSRTGPA
jgi:DNA ligase D-like protein (predicted ligase)